MPGSPPVVTLNPPSIECNAGDTITVAATVTDADTRTEVVHGTNELGVPVVVSSTAVDSAAISAARWSASSALARVSGLTVTAVAAIGAGNLEITVRDAEGNETIATCEVTVKPPTPTMLIGVTPDLLADAAAFTAHVAMYPGSKVARAYGSAGAGIPGSKSVHVAPLLAAGQKIYKSAKDLSLAAYVADWDTITQPTGYTPWHECNRPVNLNPVPFADWAKFVVQLLDARDKHKNKALIEIGPCFSWYPAAVGHNEGTPWQKWADVGKGRWNFVMVDQYNPSPKTVMAPADFVALVMEMAKYCDVHAIIGEWGVQAIAGDAGDVKAAAWIPAVLDAYRATGVVDAAIFWCSHAGTNPDYHLDARPAPLSALKKAIASQR